VKRGFYFSMLIFDEKWRGLRCKIGRYGVDDIQSQATPDESVLTGY